MELWQGAAQWLRQVGVLSQESPALARNATLYDLAMALQVSQQLETLRVLSSGWCRSLRRLQQSSARLHKGVPF